MICHSKVLVSTVRPLWAVAVLRGGMRGQWPPQKLGLPPQIWAPKIHTRIQILTDRELKMLPKDKSDDGIVISFFWKRTLLVSVLVIFVTFLLDKYSGLFWFNTEISSELLSNLSEQLQGGKAKLIEKDGQIQVLYSGSENQKFDQTQCGKIVAPKVNTKEVIESSLSLIDFIKQKRAPDGVLLDRTKISINFKGTYEEGEDYEVLDKILGKGLNGPIVVVRDKKLLSEHALKTMMLADFNTNEIRCWTDLEGHDSFPTLYMFNKQDGKIHFHHEILDKAVTISDIIDHHMLKVSENQELLHHFSLYVLQGLLEASSFMHSKEWQHDDLHEENAMLQSKPAEKNKNAELKVRVLDFGRAKKLDKEKNIKKDMEEIIRVFTSVYVTEKFDDARDLKKNWEEKLEKQAGDLQLSKENKDELLGIVKLALDVQLTEQEMELKKIVDCKLKNSLEDKPYIMQKIHDLIFPEYAMDADGMDGVDGLESVEVDSAVPYSIKDFFKIDVSKKKIVCVCL